MQVVEYRIPYTQGQRVKRIYPLGDTHFGTLHCSEDKIKAQIQIIRDDPDAYWVGMGDLGEFISRHDPRFDGKCISKWVDPNDIAGSQIDFIVGMLSPIKHKVSGYYSATMKRLTEGTKTATPRSIYAKDWV
jgi:hypothetical protein